MNGFVRFQSSVPNRHGSFPGVFALTNGLAATGVLSAEDQIWHRSANDRANALYEDPTKVTPDCYDSNVNPGALSWFKSSATDLLEMAHDYLAVLDRYGVRWVELRTHEPGRIVHEDNVQVVAVPYSYEADWPLSR